MQSGPIESQEYYRDRGLLMIRVTEFRLALAVLALAACSGDVMSPTPPAARAPAAAGSLLPWSGSPDAEASATTLINCPTPTTQSVTSHIGPLGGLLALGNTRVIIPLGAVLFPQDFTLTIPASPYAEIRVRAGDAEHYLFRYPVSMTIDYSRCATPELDTHALSVWNIDEDSRALLEPMLGVDEKLTHTIVFTTTHLSGYAVADRAEDVGTGQ
jgi:hypothetical protein